MCLLKGIHGIPNTCMYIYLTEKQRKFYIKILSACVVVLFAATFACSYFAIFAYVCSCVCRSLLRMRNYVIAMVTVCTVWSARRKNTRNHTCATRLSCQLGEFVMTTSL